MAEDDSFLLLQAMAGNQLVEIAAEGLEYKCGDSIGIVPENDSQVVTDIIQVTNADGNKFVEFKKEKTTVYEMLKRKVNIINLTERLVQQYGTVTGHSIPAGRADLLDLVKFGKTKIKTILFTVIVFTKVKMAAKAGTIWV